MKILKSFLLPAIGLAATCWGGAALALEEPAYTVVATTATYEVRRYEPYIVAEVDVSATSEKRAGGEAFRILAGYIFGDNREQLKMAMTAPVETTAEDTSTRMKMTAPVATTGSGGAYTYAFVMEQKYTLDTLPEPIDPRIRIRTKPERYVAALRYSGSWSDTNYERHRVELEDALHADGVDVLSPYTLARYNSPFALPMFRRNEVLADVRWED